LRRFFKLFAATTSVGTAIAVIQRSLLISLLPSNLASCFDLRIPTPRFVIWLKLTKSGREMSLQRHLKVILIVASLPAVVHATVHEARVLAGLLVEVIVLAIIIIAAALVDAGVLALPLLHLKLVLPVGLKEDVQVRFTRRGTEVHPYFSNEVTEKSEQGRCPSNTIQVA